MVDKMFIKKYSNLTIYPNIKFNYQNKGKSIRFKAFPKIDPSKDF